MQDALSPLSERQALSFSEFLAAPFEAFAREGLPSCVLRNYEGFPNSNIGNDLDFLILPAQLPRAIRAIRSISGVRVVGFSEREFVANLFLEGTSSAPGARAIQVDFFWNLSYRGLSYLPAEAVLQDAIPRQAGDLNFVVPSPVHEAIISLFASLLHGGWLKEKYFPQVQRTFTSNGPEVIAALIPQFGSRVSAELLNAVVEGDRKRVLGCIKPLRSSLTRRSMMRRPFSSSLAIARYYLREVAARFSRRNYESVCILGTGAYDRTRLVNDLLPILKSSAQVVEKREFTVGPPTSGETSGPGDAGENNARRVRVSLVGAAKGLILEWIRQFKGRKNLKLCLNESSYCELFIDRKRYEYSGPAWFAKLALTLMPSPDLWIFLDPALALDRPDGNELSKETPGEFEAYRSFMRTCKRYVTLDANKPAARVTEDAYAAIINALAERVNRELESRF
jgi:hypothetical protein